MAVSIPGFGVSKNPFVGCTKIAPECLNCWAEKAASSGRLQQFDQYKGVVDSNGHWTGQINFVPEVIDEFLSYKKQKTIFTPSMSDPFHQNVPDEWLDQFFAAIALTPHVTYQVFTKRPQRMMKYFTDECFLNRLNGKMWEMMGSSKRGSRINHGGKWAIEGVIPNLHHGVSMGCQDSINKFLPWLLKTPSAFRVISCEPMLEEVDFSECPTCGGTGVVEGDGHPLSLSPPQFTCMDCRDGVVEFPLEDIDLVICGGESGPNARPFHLNWARSLKEQCDDSGTEFFLKQLGSNPIEHKGKTGYGMQGQEMDADWDEPLKLRSRKGDNPNEWPDDLKEWRNGN